jgi:hypothetical protein
MAIDSLTLARDNLRVESRARTEHIDRSRDLHRDVLSVAHHSSTKIEEITVQLVGLN